MNSRKPILSKDEAKARRQQKLLLDEIDKYDWERQEQDGKTVWIPLTKDGKAVEDKLGHLIPADALLTSIMDDYYDFEQATPRSSPGNPDNVGSRQQQQKANEKTFGSVTIKKPLTQQEWTSQYEMIEKSDLKPAEKTQAQTELLSMWKDTKAGK